MALTTKPLTPGQASAEGKVLLLNNYPAAHLFDIAGGIAFIAHDWASEGALKQSLGLEIP